MVWNLVTLKTACQANFAADSRRTFKKFLAALECLRDGRKKCKTEIISSPTTAMKKYLWSPRPSRYEQLLPPKIVDSTFSPENSSRITRFHYSVGVLRFLAMRAVKVIFALFLGVTGIFGCSSTERLYPRTTTTVPFPHAETDVSDLSDSVTGPSSSNLSASVIEPSVTDEQNPLTPAREVKTN